MFDPLAHSYQARSTEWMVLALLVAFFAIGAVALVHTTAAARASRASDALAACETYAAQHGGSTSGC